MSRLTRDVKKVVVFKVEKVFFFQAEDGIRDWSVTGVQTCALPICREFRATRVRRDQEAL